MEFQRQLELARQLRESQRLGEAEAIYRQILEQKPDDATVLYELGTVLARAGDVEGATEPLRRAARLAGDRPDFGHYLALVLEMTGRFDEAVEWHRKILVMAQSYAMRENKGEDTGVMLSQMHYHLGFALEIAGKLDESESHYRRAIELNPANSVAHVNFSVLLLKRNRPEEAWREFFSGGIDPLHGKYADQFWDGSNPAGKRILVAADGTFGDTLLMSRFIGMLRERGAYVILQCQAPLLPLIGQLADEAAAIGAEAPAFDFYTHLGKLPIDLGFSRHPEPSGCPYLAVPADRRASWAGRVPHDRLLNVGLVWAGSENARTRFRVNSIEVFGPLFKVEGVRFFSLQKGEAGSRKVIGGIELVDLANDLRDFADTAAVVEQMDLVVGVDTAVTHVVGAQNKAMWALVPWRSSYLWLLDRDDSPWYPSLRLFRETKPGDWETPVREMAEELRKLVSRRK
jgi:hypothetical protein